MKDRAFSTPDYSKPAVAIDASASALTPVAINQASSSTKKAPSRRPNLKETVITIRGDWNVTKRKDGAAILEFFTESGGLAKSLPLFRFNTRTSKTDKPAAWTIENTRYNLLGERSVNPEIDPGAIMTSFYDSKSAVSKERKYTPKTPRGLDPMHRHFNLAHLRIGLGMNDPTLFDDDERLHLGAVIDDMFGPKKTGKKPSANNVKPHLSAVGGVTVGYIMRPISDKTVRITYALAVCSAKDRYNRTIGADLVVTKLKNVLVADSVGKPIPSMLRMTEIKNAETGREEHMFFFNGIGQFEIDIGKSAIRPTTVNSDKEFWEFRIEHASTGRTLLGDILCDAEEQMDRCLLDWGRKRYNDDKKKLKVSLPKMDSIRQVMYATLLTMSCMDLQPAKPVGEDFANLVGAMDGLMGEEPVFKTSIDSTPTSEPDLMAAAPEAAWPFPSNRGPAPEPSVELDPNIPDSNLG